MYNLWINQAHNSCDKFLCAEHSWESMCVQGDRTGTGAKNVDSAFESEETNWLK